MVCFWSPCLKTPKPSPKPCHSPMRSGLCSWKVPGIGRQTNKFGISSQSKHKAHTMHTHRCTCAEHWCFSAELPAEVLHFALFCAIVRGSVTRASLCHPRETTDNSHKRSGCLCHICAFTRNGEWLSYDSWKDVPEAWNVHWCLGSRGEVWVCHGLHLGLVRACVPWLFDREGDWNASSLHVPTFGVCYVFSCWRQGFCSDECLPVSRFCEDSCSTHVMWRQEDRLLKLYNFGLWEHIREHDPTEAARVLACRSFSSVASPRQALKSSCVGVAGYFPAMTMAVVSFWPCSANPRTISEVVLHFSSSLGTALHTWDIW